MVVGTPVPWALSYSQLINLEGGTGNEASIPRWSPQGGRRDGGGTGCLVEPSGAVQCR